MKSNVIASLAISFLVVSSSVSMKTNSAPRKVETEGIQIIETSNIKRLSVNYQTGRISFDVKNISYFYQVPTDKSTDRIICTDIMLRNIQKASLLRIHTTSSNGQQRIIHLELFFNKNNPTS